MIDLNNLPKELAKISDEYKTALDKEANAYRELYWAKFDLESVETRISGEIFHNPEKYGFVPGEKVYQTRVDSLVKRTAEYLLQARKRMDAEAKHSFALSERQAIEMKMRSLECLVSLKGK